MKINLQSFCTMLPSITIFQPKKCVEFNKSMKMSHALLEAMGIAAGDS